MKVISLNTNNFDAEILPVPLAVVTFWADWCGPCNNFTPKLNSLAKEFGEMVVVAKVNVEEYPQLSKRFDVNGIPHTAIFKAGQQVEKIIGDVKYDRLKERVESALASISDSDPKRSESTPEQESTKEKPNKGILETIKAFFDRITGKK